MHDPEREDLATSTYKQPRIRLVLKQRPESTSLSPKFDEYRESCKTGSDVDTLRLTERDRLVREQLSSLTPRQMIELLNHIYRPETSEETAEAVMSVENGWTGIFIMEGGNEFVAKINDCIQDGQLTEKAKDIIAKLSTLG